MLILQLIHFITIEVLRFKQRQHAERMALLWRTNYGGDYWLVTYWFNATVQELTTMGTSPPTWPCWTTRCRRHSTCPSMPALSPGRGTGNTNFFIWGVYQRLTRGRLTKEQSYLLHKDRFEDGGGGVALSYLLFVLMLSYLPPLPLLYSVEKGKKEADTGWSVGGSPHPPHIYK